MRLAVGLLFVLLADACPLALAAEWGQPAEANARQAVPRKEHEFLPSKPAENVNHTSSDVRLPLDLNEDAFFGDSTALASDPLRPTGPPIMESPYENLVELCGSCCNNPCPCMYAQVEALFWLRSPRYTNQPIIVDANTGDTFLATSDLASMFNPGIRATFGMRLCGGTALEFSYFGLFQGNSSQSVVSPNADAFLIFPDNFFGNVFVDFDRALVNYGSALNGFEANLPCCCGCCDECDDCECDDCRGESGFDNVRCRSVEWFAGFRYLNVSENLDIQVERDIAGGVERGAYRIRTSNNFYGPQVGARVRRTKGRWGWEATGKAGVFANDSQQTQRVTDFPDFDIRPTVSSRGSRVAFIGEFNLSGLYRLSEIWNLRAGYSVLWIEGVALAPDQLDFDFASAPSGNRLHDGGGLLLHGVTVGLEARW